MAEYSLMQIGFKPDKKKSFISIEDNFENLFLYHGLLLEQSRHDAYNERPQHTFYEQHCITQSYLGMIKYLPLPSIFLRLKSS